MFYDIILCSTIRYQELQRKSRQKKLAWRSAGSAGEQAQKQLRNSRVLVIIATAMVIVIVYKSNSKDAQKKEWLAQASTCEC